MSCAMNHDSFFQRVYAVTRLIPPGRVSTYGAIAACTGSPAAARMVGQALNQCFDQAVFVPAHRVVNRNGMLTGKRHFHDPDLMEQLLNAEGIAVVNDRVVDFQKLFWDPATHCEALLPR